MCMFTDIVRDVKDTNIFACRLITNSNPKQLTVYTNSVELKEPVAMILPCPNRTGDPDEITVFDSSKLDTSFFNLLNDHFTVRRQTRGMRSFTNGYVEEDSIEVENIGNYKVSRVGNYSDFSRLQFKEFNLSPGFQSVLKQFYSTNYSFIVCIIQNSVLKPHPIVYTSPMYNDQIFIPTRHYHGELETTPDWDHDIYYISDKDSKINVSKENIHVKLNEDKLLRQYSTLLRDLKQKLQYGAGIPANIYSTEDSNIYKLTIKKGLSWNEDILVN